MTKHCKYCDQTKDISGFSRHSHNVDGYDNKCKECQKNYIREWYSNNRDSQLAKQRLYRQRNRVQALDQKRRERVVSPEKQRARMTVNLAIRSGSLRREPCEVCGATPVDGHHVDYSKPLAVRWLCRTHHREEHLKIKSSR
jgi:hypothetical protein